MRGWRARWWALIAVTAACASPAASPGGGDAAGDGGDVAVASSFDPRSCDPTAAPGLALRAAGTFADLGAAAAGALAVAGCVEVTAITDDEGGTWQVGVDDRGDLLALAPSGAVWALSWCGFDRLGLMTRVHDLLARGVLAVGEASGEGPLALAPRWARPAAVFHGPGVRYWRQELPTAQRNAAVRGQIELAGAPLALRLALIGTSQPTNRAGDVVGIDRLVVAGAVIAEGDKVAVSGRGTLQWALPSGLGAGSHPLELDAMTSDASLRAGPGAWFLFIDGLFGAEGQAGLALALQGAPAGSVTVGAQISEADLPTALTRVGR